MGGIFLFGGPYLLEMWNGRAGSARAHACPPLLLTFKAPGLNQSPLVTIRTSMAFPKRPLLLSKVVWAHELLLL